MKNLAVDLTSERAKFALERAKSWSRLTKPKEAAQVVKGLPVSVRTLGLAQAAAMLGRRPGASRDLAEDLAGWLLTKWPDRPGGTARADSVGLVEWVVGSPSEVARAAEEEAIRFLEVLKLFGELLHGD